MRVKFQNKAILILSPLIIITLFGPNENETIWVRKRFRRTTKQLLVRTIIENRLVSGRFEKKKLS